MADMRSIYIYTKYKIAVVAIGTWPKAELTATDSKDRRGMNHFSKLLDRLV